MVDLTTAIDLNDLIDNQNKLLKIINEKINSWDSTWVVKTEAYTAAAKDRILADTSASTFTITLPVSPTIGDDIYIVDMGGTFGTCPLKINAGTSKLMGLDENLILDVDNQGAILVYSGLTRGWVVL